MAGAAVALDLREIEGLAQLLNGARLGDADRRQLLHDIGEEMKSSTQDRLTSPEKKDPRGNAWKAIADKTRKYYDEKFPRAKPPLWREGGLLDSVTSEAADSWSVLVGAVVEYAAVHQFGWPEKNIAARPYLGVSAQDAADIAAIAQRFTARKLA
ncbi:MAG: phage virion morphogenesis protein [Treponema sp.]|jgi:phage virion morphogenesis protein|nr:phage virion morphogenesis protein [Treponema sp.]